MEKRQIKLFVLGMMSMGLGVAYVPAVYAAKPVDLSHQKVSILQAFLSTTALSTNVSNIEEIKRNVDRKNNLHIRIQQTFSGYQVYGADAVLHIPNGASKKGMMSLNSMVSFANNTGSMNGKFYQGIGVDLKDTDPSLLTEEQAAKALKHVISNYQSTVGAKVSVEEQQSSRLIFIDKQNKAHWAYQVSFAVAPQKSGELPSKPVAIVDAKTFEVYAEWNNIKTLEDAASAIGGGFGGNKKMGKLSYDGLTGELHLSSLPITRDTTKCALKNDDVTVKNYRGGAVMSYKCDAADPNHNSVYWNGDVDAVNDGYSPMNDAMFAGLVLKRMYQDWYGVPVLIENGKPMMLNMVVHDPIDNAYWDGRQMTFGDGVDMFYPLTSLGVGAHEVSHGFTEQNSGLAYYGESGGMNEAFSDMAAQAAEFFAYQKNSWQIGPEIFKRAGQALRYMDKPSKDCNGKKPGSWCSIDEVSQYYEGLDVHFSSGIYNRAFYNMGTADGWDPKKAFDVMVHANQNYWTSNTSWVDGACGVLKATKDLGYDVETVQKAFKIVGVDTSTC